MREYGMEPPRFEKAPLGLKFRLIHERFKAVTNEEMQQFDLTYSQMWVLWYLINRKGTAVRQRDLCEAAHVKHPTMVGLLQRLEAKGLVTLAGDPDDRRQNLVSLTDKAEDIMRRQKATRDERDLQMVAGMNEREMQQLNTLLGKIYDNLEQVEKGTLQA